MGNRFRSCLQHLPSSKEINPDAQTKTWPSVCLYPLDNYLSKVYCLPDTVLSPGPPAEHTADQGSGLMELSHSGKTDNEQINIKNTT